MKISVHQTCLKVFTISFDPILIYFCHMIHFALKSDLHSLLTIAILNTPKFEVNIHCTSTVFSANK